MNAITTPWKKTVGIALAALFAMLFLGLSGCASLPAEDKSASDQLPWNSPAGWESTTIGVPY
jgi:hypothetical protein